jgi:phosphoglycerate dehydrogenase-like enzyme
MVTFYVAGPPVVRVLKNGCAIGIITLALCDILEHSRLLFVPFSFHLFLRRFFRMKVFIAVSPKVAATSAGGNPLLAFFEELGDFPVELSSMDDTVPLSEQVSEAEVIIPAVSKIDAEVINAAPNLKLIIQAGVGLDGVDVEAATRRGVYVANVPYGSAASMGELTIALMILLSRRLNEAQENLRKGVFFLPLGAELDGKTLGLVGLGHSGKETARRARNFEMKILAVDKYHEHIHSPDVDFLAGIDQLDKILTESDFVSLHCPLNEETCSMIGYEQIYKMKETAYFINIARAGLVDRDGLLRALKERRIAGAGLDVFWEEPISLDDELLKLDNVVLTPHVATSTFESRARNFAQVAKAIKRVARGDKPEFCVNF